MYHLGGPETPENFSTVISAATSLTVQWDPKVAWGHNQTFYMQYRVQGLLEWTTVLIGEEAVNESKRRSIIYIKQLKARKSL